jgi:hypothetical protein
MRVRRWVEESGWSAVTKTAYPNPGAVGLGFVMSTVQSVVVLKKEWRWEKAAEFSLAPLAERWRAGRGWPIYRFLWGLLLHSGAAGM